MKQYPEISEHDWNALQKVGDYLTTIYEDIHDLSPATIRKYAFSAIQFLDVFFLNNKEGVEESFYKELEEDVSNN